MTVRSLCRCAGGFALAVALVQPAFSEKVGVAAAVNPSATGHAPGQSLRELKIGSDVVHNERIRTSSAGSTQVIFIDRTTLTISANSDLTINRFVYDPAARTGSLAATVGSGLVRFVGGQVSHSGNVEIVTPSGNLGIRGGVAVIDVNHGTTTVLNLYGITTLQAGSSSVTISRPGYFAVVSGGDIPAPRPAPPGMLAAFNARLQSKPGQTGGAKPGLVTSQKIRETLSGFKEGKVISPSANPFQNVVNSAAQTSQTGVPLTGPNGGGGGGGGLPPPPPGGGPFTPPGLTIAPGQGLGGNGPPGQNFPSPGGPPGLGGPRP
jgi:hypothetical protein